ncbi:6409_t:CDS:10 [Entrophospora sp. SA101]|nr:6409_t:CDS:10 [Entrophospora sp. SA101]
MRENKIFTGENILIKNSEEGKKQNQARNLIEFRYHGNNLKFIIIEIITSSSSLNKNNSNKESVGEPNDDYKEEEEIIYERKEIKIIKEIIENAFNNYNLFKEFGLNPPKGILLYGPSGTGKTLIFNAVASETNSYKIFINGPEVISKYYGETESKLKSIFEKALENSPSIIFIDEIDALCPKRDQVNNESSKRVVAMMLTLMDGISNKGDDKNGKVIVIGSTNRPNSLDEALRRPGRFDKEIEIGIPNSHSRSLILQTLLKDIPSSLTIDEIESFSSKLHGYVGADLSAICREAGLKVIKNRVRNNIDGNDEDNNNKNDKDDIKITLKDLEDAMLKVRPSAMREIILEIPKVYWKDVGGQNEIKQKLKESIEWPLKYSEKFKNLGIKPPKGILMYGPPGCSKTLMAKALATEANLNFIAVKGPELFSKWVGESEKAVREIFRKARAASPSIIFFVIKQVLNNVTIVAATNRPDIMVKSRIDRILYVGLPDFLSRKEIFNIQLNKMSHSNDVDIDELANRTEGCSGAEIVSLCQESALNAMEEDINITQVCRRHFVRALNNLSKRITPEMIEFYETFAKKSKLKLI